MGKKDEPKEAPPVEVPPVEEPPKDPPGWELVWSVLSKEQTQMLCDQTTPTALIQSLCEILHVAHYDRNPRSRVWVDFCFYNWMFAKEEANWSQEKLALFFAITTKVFQHATSTPWPSLEANYALLRDLLKQHSVNLPQANFVAIFTLEDVARIVRYLTTTFYQHFKAYQLAFQVHPELERCVHKVVVETPLHPLPLAMALEQPKAPTPEDPERPPSNTSTGEVVVGV